jgi:hypothetical protein
MKTLRTFILGFVCVVGIALSPNAAFAALDLISFQTNPKTPGPNQLVTVSLQSYAIDLDSANLTWYVDKEVVANGIGEKSIQTMVKDLGETVTINVVILAANSARYDKQFLLRPIEVDLLWEADTFVPPFYKGKALPTYKSIVKLSAIPRFNTFSSNPSRYSYAWTANQIQNLEQGIGKQSVLVPMKYSGSSVPIEVTVTDLSALGDTTGTTSATRLNNGSAMQRIVAINPLLLFYEDAPLLGVRFNQALSGGVTTNGTSFTLRAVPYFFSNDDIVNANLSYTWQQDRQKLNPSMDPNILVLGKEGTAAQVSTIGLLIQNSKRILQSANAGVTINFTAE